MKDRLKKIEADLAELVSHGTNHPEGPDLIGRLRVELQQATDAFDEPPPPTDPVDEQLKKMFAMLEALVKAVAEGKKIEGKKA